MGARRRDRGDGRRHGSTKAALKTGQIDGVVIALELGYALEQAKEWRVLAPLAPFAPDFHTHVIYARDDLIAKKPDVVERFLRSWFETIAFMRANKERTVEITAKVLNLDKAVISRVYDEQIKIFTADGRFDPRRWSSSGSRWWRWASCNRCPRTAPCSPRGSCQ
jgi:NitT/TauT family transport system substrate-binding protein